MDRIGMTRTWCQIERHKDKEEGKNRKGFKKKEEKEKEKRNNKEKDKEKEGRLCNRADSKHRYSWAIKSSEKESLRERERQSVLVCISVGVQSFTRWCHNLVDVQAAFTDGPLHASFTPIRNAFFKRMRARVRVSI